MGSKYMRRSKVARSERSRRLRRERVLFERSGLSEGSIDSVVRAERLRRAAAGKGGWKARQDYREALRGMAKKLDSETNK